MDAGDQDNFLEALLDRLSAQGTAQVSGSNEVRELIGEAAVRRWGPYVRQVRCQTCGDPFVSRADISADGIPGGDRVVLSVHHSVCRPSGVRLPSGPGRWLTMALTAMVLPSNDGTEGLFAMVVNPSCERLELARGSDGNWRNATLDGFAGLDFTALTGALPSARGITARLDGTRLVTQVTAAGTTVSPREWALDLPEAAVARVRADPFIAVAVTSKIVPGRGTGVDVVRRVFPDPDTLAAAVPLTHS